MDPFEFHTGFSSTDVGKDNKKTDCPFCGKEQHFFFNEESHQWDCKRCGRHGNLYNFIREFYDVCKQPQEMLTGLKGLPYRSVKHYGVRWNQFLDCYIIPSYKAGRLNNLLKFMPSYSNNVMGTPTLDQSLFHWEENPHDTIWLVEGHWDAIAGHAITGTFEEITVTGMPGASSFKQSWLPYLRDKNVVLIFDNDDAGRKGKERFLKLINDSPVKPRKLQEVVWEADKPKGYDLRDFYLEYKLKALNHIKPLIRNVETDLTVSKPTVETVIEDPSCDTFDKALTEFKKIYHTTRDIEQALLLCLSSIYGPQFGGEQLWCKIIGPPGSGKTTIGNSISASESVVSKSTFTGLFSGWSDDSGTDASLIPLIQNKTLFVKDADPLLQQPNIQQILSELRDFYDKNSSPHYKNRVSYDYRNIRSSIIICGTNVLRRADNTFLGERFPDLELNVSEEDETLIYHKMMQVSLAHAQDVGGPPPETKLQAAMKGFINHLQNRRPNITISQEEQMDIINEANLVAKLRTQVDRNRRGEITFHPVPELATRLLGQLTKLVQCSCVVLDLTTPNKEVLDLKKKVVTDIIGSKSARFKICDLLGDAEQPITAQDIVNATEIPKSTLNRELNDMHVLGFIDAKEMPTVNPGPKPKGIVLNPKLKQAMRRLTCP